MNKLAIEVFTDELSSKVLEQMEKAPSKSQIIADMIDTRYRLLDSAKRQNGEPAMNAQAMQARSMASTIDRWIAMFREAV